MKKKTLLISLLSLLLAIVMLSSVAVQVRAEAGKPQAYNAKSALIMDYNTAQILHEQNAKEHRPIASMVKIMTLQIIFDSINSGVITLDDDIVASQNAASMGGSQAFLDANNAYKVSELIKSIVVASANDSCVAMAEHLAGDVTAFVAKMNAKVGELGLSDTYFVNCTGLPAPNQYSCAYDVAIMMRELIQNPEFFEYAKIWMYDFAHPSGRVTGLTNTNKLVRFYEGCDGGKTGFTSEALSCLAATAKRGDTRLIAVAIGSPSSKERNAEVSKMFNWGFANYETKQIVFKDGDIVENIPVSGGKQRMISAAPQQDYYLLLKKGTEKAYTIDTELSVVKAPVKEGDQVGRVLIKVEGELVAELALLSKMTIKKSNFLDVIDQVIEEWN